MKLETDGVEYDILADAVKSVKDVPGLILEIGTRKGGSMQIIIDALLDSGQENRHVLSVDPYGHIPYNTGNQFGITRYDYTNDMKKKAMADLFTYVQGKPVNFIPICWTDVEFMEHFSQNGWPVYDVEEKRYFTIAFAFLDGPHDTDSVFAELVGLQCMPAGGAVVIDNIDYFDMDGILGRLTHVFDVVKRGDHKIWLCRRSWLNQGAIKAGDNKIHIP